MIRARLDLLQQVAQTDEVCGNSAEETLEPIDVAVDTIVICGCRCRAWNRTDAERRHKFRERLFFGHEVGSRSADSGRRRQPRVITGVESRGQHRSQLPGYERQNQQDERGQAKIWKAIFVNEKG